MNVAQFQPLEAKCTNECEIQWGVRIPMRDGVQLNATLYLPTIRSDPAPALFTLTPYVSQTYHDVALYFAERGFPFATIDVRGRGNSEGEFWPLKSEGPDGCDAVAWLASQEWCNGKVAMWGGSYSGFNQWATAAQLPSSLATIAPVAPCYVGVDYPIRNNIPWAYVMQWLLLVAGRTSQEKMFWGNERFWGAQFRRWAEAGRPYRDLDGFLGIPSRIFQEWVKHSRQDDYWDSYNPSPDAYDNINVPVLTITGIYDAAQLGALQHYNLHVGSAGKVKDHYLVIGPWDHAGTRAPKRFFAGQEFGGASLVDLPRLHLEWYRWTMQGGPRPSFLRDKVAYYVTGAEQWRFAGTLEAITARHDLLFFASDADATKVDGGGKLLSSVQSCKPDEYQYDPKDMSDCRRESEVVDLISLRPLFPVDNLCDEAHVRAKEGQQLVYHSEPFDRDTEISGFFRMTAWIAIDQPDTDFRVCIYEISLAGRSVLLTTDSIRARHREGLRTEQLITTCDPLEYWFDNFTFTSRLIEKGSRLRVVIGPMNSIYDQKNYNSGKMVADESAADARTVSVKLFHDAHHPSTLSVPIAA